MTMDERERIERLAPGGRVHALLEKDEGDRLRRLSAVMRFLGHMRDSADERELILSLIQAGAVWYDLDARVYRRELDGRFVLEAWLPGADVTHDPHELDVDAVLTPDGPTHISSINELEQFGWQSVQGEVLLLPIVAADMVRRILVVAGPVEPEIEATLLLVCRSAGAVLDHLAERRGRDVRGRLVRRMAVSSGSFQSFVRAVVEEYLGAVEAAAARVAVTRPGQPTVTLYSTGGEGWSDEPVPALAPGAVEVGTKRIALGFALGNGEDGVIELLASPARPFTIERAQAARVGADVLSIWLAGISVGATRTPAQRVPEIPVVPPFEVAMREELAKAKRLSLNGGVLVASVPGATVPDPRVLSIVIRTVRAELRSADLLGQLTGGDIAAVLVRTNADGVARAAERVRERLDALARSRQLPPVVVGHALYPARPGESPAALVARARKDAGLVFS
jgi:hypothetical protein